jgi:hypothetical protein
MTDEAEIEVALGAVFDELIELIGEAKQAAWTASAPERRQIFDNLKGFLVQQAIEVDDAEQRIGTRPPWIRSPTGHRVRNIAGEAGGDPSRLVQLLIHDIRTVAADIASRAAALDGEWREVLTRLAHDLELQIESV